MNTLLQLALLLPSLGAAALQCYICEDVFGGDQGCSATDMPGNLADCPADRDMGCYISQVASGSTVVFIRGCTAVKAEAEFVCQDHNSGTQHIRFCNCKGDGCNKDFDTAAGPSLQCYVCNSATGANNSCTSDVPGDLKDCPFNRRKGCTISTSTFGTETVFERQCSEQADPGAYTCADIGSHGQGMHYCNCKGAACNKDWDTAQAHGAASGFPPLLSLSSLLSLATLLHRGWGGI